MLSADGEGLRFQARLREEESAVPQPTVRRPKPTAVPPAVDGGGDIPPAAADHDVSDNGRLASPPGDASSAKAKRGERAAMIERYGPCRRAWREARDRSGPAGSQRCAATSAADGQRQEQAGGRPRLLLGIIC
jgi:hypothetical protein